MIKLVGVSKSFTSKGVNKKAIDEVSFLLPNSGMVFVLGDSGSGKSTLLNLIAGYLKADSGSIFVDGDDIASFNEKQLDRYHHEKIGFIFQDYCLLESMSVETNLYIGDKKTKKEKKEMALALKKVGLEGYEKRKVSSLSGGEKQRLAFARATIKKPPIILADEPCGNLDERNSQLILDLLFEMAKTSLVIIVSHNLDDAYHYGDRVLILEQGKLQEDLSYDPALIDEDYKMIDSSSYMANDSLSKISQDISKGVNKGIYRRKDAFAPTKEIAVKTQSDYVKPQPNHFIKGVLRLFNKSFLRIGAFAFVIGIILSIFSISFSISHFSSDETLARILEEQEATSVTYLKATTYEGELLTNYTYPFEDEDLEAIYEAGYSGKNYPLVKLSIGAGMEGGLLSAERRLGSDVFAYFYPQAFGGILLCDEAFMKTSLHIEGELDILTLEGDENDGIYITDYMADAFIKYCPSLFATREDLLGEYTRYGRSIVYIKGIIDTDYEETLAPLKEALANNATNYYSLFASSQYSASFDYMRDALSIAYYTGDDFYSYLKTARRFLYKYQVFLVDELGKMNFEYNGKYLSYCTLLEDDEILLQSAYLEGQYVDMDDAQIESYLNEGEDQFHYRGYGSSSINYTGIDNLLERSFKTVLIDENHPEYYEDDSAFGEKISGTGCIYVSKNVFESLLSEDTYAYSYYFDNVSSAIGIKSQVEENNCLFITSISNHALNSVDEATHIFGNLFEIIYFASFIIAFAIIVYYAISGVLTAKYEVGVLKSQGYGGGELTLYYLLGIAIFFVFVVGLYLLSYFLMIGLINDVILASLASSYSTAVLLVDYGLFQFDVFLSALLFLGCFALLALLSFLCLFILRKVRVANILRKKE